MGNLQTGTGFSLARERLLAIKLEMVLTVVKSMKSEDTKAIFDITVLLQIFIGLFLSLFWAARGLGTNSGAFCSSEVQ